MMQQSVALAGNLLLDIFIDTTTHSVPADIAGPVHRSSEELRVFLDRIDLGTVNRPAPGVTIRAGGAAGNVARMLAERGHHSSLYGAAGSDDLRERYVKMLGRPPVGGLISPYLWDAETTGHSITWYDPAGEEENRILVAPPPTLPEEIWPALLSSDAAIVYIDGYAIPGYLTSDDSHSRDFIASEASFVFDLAHPDVTGRCAAELCAILARLAAASRETTVFASTAELEPLGGLKMLAASIEEGKLTLVIKEPPFGATVYRLHRSGAEVQTRHRGEVVHALETTGLGDAFVAGWIAALLDGLGSADELLRHAHAAAQACALCVGGVST